MVNREIRQALRPRKVTSKASDEPTGSPFKGVAMGVLVIIGGGFLLGIIFGRIYMAVAIGFGATPREVMSDLRNPAIGSIIWSFYLLVGAGMGIVGGYLSARYAGKEVWLSTAALCIVLCGMGVLGGYGASMLEHLVGLVTTIAMICVGAARCNSDRRAGKFNNAGKKGKEREAIMILKGVVMGALVIAGGGILAGAVLSVVFGNKNLFLSVIGVSLGELRYLSPLAVLVAAIGLVIHYIGGYFCAKYSDKYAGKGVATLCGVKLVITLLIGIWRLRIIGLCYLLIVFGVMILGGMHWIYRDK